MKMRSLLVACIVGLSFVGGCGGPEAKVAHVTPQNMPDGQEWDGVYFHQVYGYLHLKGQDQNVVGKWQRTDKSAWGTLSGTKNGNVLHFQWKETKYGMVGPSATQQGRGYFVYTVGKDDIANLTGEYGLGQDEVGSEWNAIKQMRMNPDLNSITGDVPGGGPQQGGLE